MSKEISNHASKRTIGDNYEADIQGAIAVGLDVILFNYHKYNVPANIKQVNHLADIKRYL